MNDIRDGVDKLAELNSGGNREHLDQAKADLDQVREFLDKSHGDIDGAKDNIGETVEDLESMSDGLKELLKDPDVKKAIDGVKGGLESTSNVVGKVEEGLEKVDELLESLQKLDDLTKEDAQEQLEAFAEAFETVVDKLDPLIKLVPGLGAFLGIYALGIRNIAESAGILSAIVDRNSTLYADLGRDGYLYLTSDALKQIAISELEARHEQLVEEGLEIAREERGARERADLSIQNTDVEAAVKSALRSSLCTEPGALSPAEQAWGAATTALAGAEEAHNAAATNLEFAGDASPETTARLQEELRLRESELADARDTLESAAAEKDAEWAAYHDCVKSEIARFGAHANTGAGFSDLDYLYLAYTYPQWTLTPGTAPAPTAKTANKIKMVRVGGAFAGLALGLGFLLVSVSGDDAETTTPQTPESAESFPTTPPSEESSETPASSVDVDSVHPCDARREEQIVLDFFSPDFSSGVPQPSDIVEIPLLFTSAGNGGNREFLTPALEWSAVPPETTEIAIYIGEAPEEAWEKYRDRDNIYDQLIPLVSRWILVGLSPSATSLGRTSINLPLPEDSIELVHQGPGASYDGVESANHFVGPNFPERRFIFGVAALCDRDLERDPYNIGALRSDAIAVGHFLASPDW